MPSWYTVREDGNIDLNVSKIGAMLGAAPLGAGEVDLNIEARLEKSEARNTGGHPNRILVDVCSLPGPKLGDTSRRSAAGCHVIRITQTENSVNSDNNVTGSENSYEEFTFKKQCVK